MQNVEEFVHTYLVVYLSLVSVLLIACGGYVKKHERIAADGGLVNQGLI